MNWINSNTDKARVAELVKAQGKVLAANVETLDKFLKKAGQSAEERKSIQAALDQLKGYQKTAADTIDMSEADVNSATMMASSTLEDRFQALNKTLLEILAIQDRMSQRQYDEAQAGFRQTLWVFSLVLAAAIVLSLGLNVFLARTISRPVQQAGHTVQQIAQGDLTREVHLDSRDEIGELVRAINEMRIKFGEAVSQSVAMSQSLSGAASQQAASIEETSSSLEEMAAMTKQNAGNADQANRLITVTSGLMGRANTSMGDLTSSMQEIARASEQTQRIVKTIDEIAFQTNLLALNAAVEAARAGEAGAGFAVVADEVRNLAMRAAEAARNTSGLIEDIVKKIQGGVSVVTATNQNFNEVTGNSNKVRELVEEIAAASNEQSQGIEQINQAVAEMNKVTQQNASGAEELAAVMATFKTGGDHGPTAPARRNRTLSAGWAAETAGPPGRISGKEISPREVIPLGEDDFH
jgi:methyl-accepting chemotaxis protein